MKLVIFDAHEGLKPVVSKVFQATQQRCRVHLMLNAMAQTVAALLRTVFAQDSQQECHRQWSLVADQLRKIYPKIAALMDGWEDEVLVYMDLPKSPRHTGSSCTATIHWSG